MGKHVIVACDFNSKERLEEFLDSIEELDSNIYCKVGMELFDSGALEGFNPVQIIKNRGHKVFLDLKLKDIPNTVSKTVKKLVEAEVDMINLHADGGYKMMKAAVDTVEEVYGDLKKRYQEIEEFYDLKEFLKDKTKDELDFERNRIKQKLHSKPLLLGVTVLTSMGEEELKNEIGIDKTPREQVVSLAKLCKSAGLDGVVCSPEEILAVKEACGEDFITVTPGIRFSDSKKDDQMRIATPAVANIMGSDYIVVGRPITEASNPLEAYERCRKDFIEEVTDVEELDKAKIYMQNLQIRENQLKSIEEAEKCYKEKAKKIISERESLKLK